MKQITFSQIEFESKKRLTKREKFLGEMESVVPWKELVSVIEPYYPRGYRGRPPIGIERMLRLYFIQQWYGLSDEGVEETITDSQAMRAFVGIDLLRESVPDATTLLHFRHLLETHALTQALFERINEELATKGLLMKEGTIADATLLAAPSSTKNKSKERDPQMHSTKKGQQYYFGMKAHIGVDAQSGLVHSLAGTAANETDITQTEHLLHGQEKVIHLDAGYTGAEKREELKDRKVTWLIAARRGKIRRLPEQSQYRQLFEKLEKAKASIRSKVEHVFHILKNLFHFRKVRYKGLVKNTAQLYMLFGLVNLVKAKQGLMALRTQNPF